MNITIPKRVRHEGDRVGGIEWALPWLPELGPVPDLPEAEPRPANEREHAAVRKRVADALREHGLIILSIDVQNMTRPDGIPRARKTEVHLIVHVVGYRWADATDPPQPALAWWPGYWDDEAEPPQADCGSKDISEALTAYRKARKLTQKQLCERWGVPISTIKQWEQGSRKPSPAGPIWRLMELD